MQTNNITIYLTSSHTLGWAGDLNPKNGLAEELCATLPNPLRCLMITSYPDDQEITDRMAWEIRECFENEERPFDHFEVLDRRNEEDAARMIQDANFIILCGGHVPTENNWFKDIKLRQRIKKFQGILLSISAGSMNCAETVYASPEHEGEAIDPKYKRHIKGLGLVNINILPHFQELGDVKIDGMHLIKEIVAKDSYKHPVYCLPDGSYFHITAERTELRGLAFKMHNGRLRKICNDNERKKIRQ